MSNIHDSTGFDGESRDTSLEPMTFEAFKSQASGLGDREASILQSIDWHGLVPNDLTWDMLQTALKPALMGERLRSKKATLERRGVTIERGESGCEVFRVAAWAKRATAKPRRKR